MYFVVDPDRDVAPQHADFVWQCLWDLRDVVPIGAIIPAVVSSPCPLLPSEPAQATVVATLTQVPADTAWATIEVDLPQFVGSDGALRQRPLEAALRAAVEEGEQRHVETRWDNAGQRRDSRINRRLSVFVRGWGDVVGARRLDPRAVDTLRELEALADLISGTLETASRRLAAEHGYCPALDIAGARVLQYGEEMNARWRRAVNDNALRHRNLLTMSAWDVFPRGEPARFEWMNLLPVLRKAHSVSLRRDVDISCWSARDFRAFHQRVSAILRSASEAPLVARQV